LKRNKPEVVKRMGCSFVYFLCKKHADMNNDEFGDYMEKNKISDFFMELRRESLWQKQNI
jgi:hypothetical protein